MEAVKGMGIDLVKVDRIKKICQKHQKKFLDRVFTKQERIRIISRAGNLYPRIAARFAAKEAVLKALGCGIGPARLQEVEVISEGNHPPQVKLHGQASLVAEKNSITRVLLSLSHEKTLAIAQAMAYGPSNIPPLES